MRASEPYGAVKPTPMSIASQTYAKTEPHTTGKWKRASDVAVWWQGVTATGSMISLTTLLAATSRRSGSAAGETSIPWYHTYSGLLSESQLRESCDFHRNKKHKTTFPVSVERKLTDYLIQHPWTSTATAHRAHTSALNASS